MYYTYVLECFSSKTNNKKIYIGFSSNLKTRLYKHRAKSVKTTKKFDIITLIYYEASLNKKDAMIRELQLKTGFGRGYLNRRLKNYIDSQR